MAITHTDTNIQNLKLNKFPSKAAFDAAVNANLIGDDEISFVENDMVQADWNESDSGSEAYILNKPTIPAAQVQSDWDATSGMGVILNKPTIPAAQVQSDWDATSGMGVILNKPTLVTITSKRWTNS